MDLEGTGIIEIVKITLTSNLLKMNITLRLKDGTQKDGRTSIIFDVAHTLENKQKYRKKITTGIKLKRTDLNKTSFRVKASNRNSEIINKGIKKLVAPEEMR